jgi:hypothetical protein
MKKGNVLAFVIGVVIFPYHAFALTDNSIYPQFAPWVLSFTVTSADVAACLASNPLDDRFEFDRVGIDSVSSYSDVLFAGFSGPMTISSTSATEFENFNFDCSQGQGNPDSGAPEVIMNGYFFKLGGYGLYDSTTTVGVSGGGVSTSSCEIAGSTGNGLGTLFTYTFLWYLVLLVEMLILFIGLYGFVCGYQAIWSMIGL